MNKCYGICMTDCDVIDEVGKPVKLEITKLVQIVYACDEKYAIKIFKDEGTTKIDSKVYQCQKKNVSIIPSQLLKYLTISDYWGRLDILRFKKKILNLKVGSKGKLQVLYNNSTLIINFEVKFIGPADHYSDGHYVGIYFPEFDYRRDLIFSQSLFRSLAKNKNYKIEFLIVQVEHLFSEIELNDPPYCNEFLIRHLIKKAQMYQFRTTLNPFITIHPNVINQSEELGTKNTKTVSDISDVVTKYFLTKNKFQEQMDVDNNSFDGNKTSADEKLRNSILNADKLLNNIDEKQFSQFLDQNLENLEQKAKMCLLCQQLENLFTFPCTDVFCWSCLLKLFDKVEVNLKTFCPSCGFILASDELKLLTEFINHNISKKETSTKTKDNYTSKKNVPLKIGDKNRRQSNMEKIKESSEKEKKNTLGGNKIENRFCKSCKTTNTYSAISCNSCHRSLAPADYSYTKI